MKRRGNLWLRILGALLGLFVVLVVLAAAFGPAVLRRVVSRWASVALGTRVDVAGLSYHPLEGSAAIRGLVIHNLPGFGGAPMLTIRELYLRAGRQNQLAELRLDMPELGFAIDGRGRTNWVELLTALSNKFHMTNLPTTSGQSNLAFSFPAIDLFKLSVGELVIEDARVRGPARRIPLGIQGRCLTNVTSGADFAPLAGEILLRGAMGWLIQGGQPPSGGR